MLNVNKILTESGLNYINFWISSVNRLKVQIKIKLLTAPNANIQLFVIQIFDKIAQKAIHQIGNNTFEDHFVQCKLTYFNSFRIF